MSKPRPQPKAHRTYLPSFDSEASARTWMQRCMDQEQERCVDGERFAFMDDPTALAAYKDVRDNGCDGFFDQEVLVAGRRATIGCNFGH